MRYLLICSLFLIGCNESRGYEEANRCLEWCNKQGKHIKQFSYSTSEGTVCTCSKDDCGKNEE